MNEYTPTTDEVRAAVRTYHVRPAEFDRWLTQVRAEVWDEGWEDRHGLPATQQLRTLLSDRIGRNPYRAEGSNDQYDEV